MSLAILSSDCEANKEVQKILDILCTKITNEYNAATVAAVFRFLRRLEKSTNESKLMK